MTRLFTVVLFLLVNFGFIAVAAGKFPPSWWPSPNMQGDYRTSLFKPIGRFVLALEVLMIAYWVGRIYLHL